MMKNKLLILDLDETLIHASTSELSVQEDLIFGDFFVYKRPFLEEFLCEVQEDYIIGIWSSASEDYINGIVDHITPPGFSFEFIWGRSRCSYRRDMERDTYLYEKRLAKLKGFGYKLENILIVDDTSEKSRVNYGNAIHIKAFIGDKNDEELQHLSKYLRTLKDVNNVRSVEKRGWRKKG